MFFKSDYNDLMPPFPEQEDTSAEKRAFPVSLTF